MAEQISVQFLDDDDDGGASRRGGSDDGGAAARQRLAQAQMQRQSQIHEAEKAALTARSEAQAAQHEYAQAAETGDFDKQAAATRKMSAAEGRVLAAEQAQAYWQRSPVSGGDQFEDHLSRFTPATADWIRQHRDWVEDPARNAELSGAHHRAVREGHVPDSNSYFRFVEKYIGIADGGNGSSGGSVSRGRTPGDGNTVRLTKSQVEMANSGAIVWNRGDRDLNGEVIREGDPRIGKAIGTHAYAHRLHAMRKAGYMDRL